MRNYTIAILFVIQFFFAQEYTPVGKYTGKNWKQWIDTAWGQGVSTNEKLAMFDLYWNTVDQTFGGFVNQQVNWDSLKNVYRPKIETGVSRGRFYGILTRLTMALNEWHVYAVDMGIDSSFKHYGLYEYPITSFDYKPGIPLFASNELFYTSNFGAGVTTISDSIALVYSVMPNHPLGLHPGDIILGYDGIPWKKLMEEILAAELPVIKGGAVFGSTPAVHNHVGIMCAGMNWGLFDTIDVFKYATKQTVHFPTSLLSSIKNPFPIATEQLPVKGIPFPNLAAKEMVSWGIVEGTNIGYIYTWDWYGVPTGNTQTQFYQAVTDLVLTKKVDGLILDSRTNWGGAPRFANSGFSILFNEDPTSNYQIADRVPGNDHFLFTVRSAPSNHFFTPTSYIFDRPIAVLTGPNSGSSGDYNPFRLRFHPMTRFFGKPTNGAFTFDLSPEFTYGSSYWYALPRAAVYTKINNEGYLDHRGNPVDEELWLTQEGVAKGEDAVVKRALEWINNEAHAHSPAVNKTTFSWNESVKLNVIVRNPLSHTISLRAFTVRQDSGPADTAQFFNDGMHDDGAANDSIWGCYLKTPNGNTTFNYKVQFSDLTAGTSRTVFYKNALSSPVKENNNVLPLEYSLSQNYPNPFNPSTTIRYALPSSAHVKLTIHDILGREIASLVNEEQSAGWKEVQWNAKDVSSGIYFYKLQADNFVETQKMLVVK